MTRVVIGLLEKDNLFLIAKRPESKSYAGYWEFPGGKVEPGESSYLALKREWLEELNVCVLNAELLFSQQNDNINSNVIHLEVFKIFQISGNPTAMEGQELAWAALDKLANLNILPGNHAVLERVKNSAS